jgi:recombination protein RecA
MAKQFPQLEAIIKATSKKFGKDLSGDAFEPAEPLSSGSVLFDIATGIGGIPLHRVIEIYGFESSGKTSLCMKFLAEAQKRRRALGIEKKDLIIDIEHSIDSHFIEAFGINLEDVIHVRPDTAEEALQVAIDYPKSGAIDFVLLDSVDGLQNERQLARNVGETDVGGISKDMSFALRQISKQAPKLETTYLFINQVRMNPGQMMGNQLANVTPGMLYN